jgi:hypothetical protein
MRRSALLGVLLVLAAMPAALAQGGRGEGQGGGRQRAAGENPACGAELVVVRTDGQREQHASAEKFLTAFVATEIDQGEQPRRAVKLDTLLKAYGAGWVEVLDCRNRSAHLPGGMPVTVPEYLVLTGRGGLKAVREVRPGSYSNTVQQIRKLTFHGVKAERRTEVK